MLWPEWSVMAFLHIYRRGHIFWWPLAHPIGDSRKLDICLSLKTFDQIEASRRGAAVRLMAISDELIRLSFAQYFKAIKAAGHEALFPKLVSEREGAKKGDTVYKRWWIYIAPQMTTRKRGQAVIQ